MYSCGTITSDAKSRDRRIEYGVMLSPSCIHANSGAPSMNLGDVKDSPAIVEQSGTAPGLTFVNLGLRKTYFF